MAVMSVPPVVEPAVRRGRVAVSVSFAVNGALFASVLARVPAIRDTFELSATRLGLLLLCVSFGAVAALPSAGPIVQRIGATAAVRAAATTMMIALLLSAVGLATGTVVVVGLSFVLVGVGTGIWDVGMNVEGAEVERRMGRSVLPRMHGWWSVGSVGGAALSAACARAGVPLAVQIMCLAPIGWVAVMVALRHYLTPVTEGRQDDSERIPLRAAWTDRRTLLLGVLTLGFAFAEGAANEWLSLSLVDGYGTSEAIGALGFGAFTTAMTVGRLLGSGAVDRWGRAAVLRSGAGVALAGLAIVVVGGVLGAPPAVALVGALIWGLGTSLGFPVGVGAAADDPIGPAVRVSVVTTIAYAAFLAGPPVIGPLADALSLPLALAVIALPLAWAFLLSGVARPVAAPAAPVRVAPPAA